MSRLAAILAGSVLLAGCESNGKTPASAVTMATLRRGPSQGIITRS